ncbi:MAG: hypothetical protein JJT76_08025 [Clostridiaceae bacterium]|nr:hypothetical protein [Clostridiaceae bacterium]
MIFIRNDEDTGFKCFNEAIKSTYVDNDLVFDAEVTLGVNYSKNKICNTYREILTLAPY